MTERPSRAPEVATRLATLMLVFAAAFGVYLIASAITGAVWGGHEVAVHQTAPVDRLGELPADVVVPETVPVTVRVRDADGKQLALSVARDFAPVLLAIVGLWLLRGLLRSVRDGDPFTDANVRRLRAMGLLLAVGLPVGSVVVSAFEGALAATAPSAGDLGSSFTISFAGPIAGLGLFVLAEVFARGVRMRDDIEGTV